MLTFLCLSFVIFALFRAVVLVIAYGIILQHCLVKQDTQATYEGDKKIIIRKILPLIDP